MSTTRILAFAGALMAGDGVERPTRGTAPSAFRIWKAGTNVTDYGPHEFTERSARMLMAEQAKRGNLYAVDVDHMSLNPEAPPESHRAVGWHRLEVRDGDGGPELWAVDCQWTDAVRAGLESTPPEWRYFSPAYDVKDGEIVSYLNTALTNNPATHQVTALATVRIAASAGDTLQALRARVDAAAARLAALERRSDERARTKILESRPDLSNEQRGYLASRPSRDVQQNPRFTARCVEDHDGRRRCRTRFPFTAGSCGVHREPHGPLDPQTFGALGRK